MDVKQAVQVAKDYVLDLFAEDGVGGLRLEEIERGADGVWDVTLGFARPLALVGPAGEFLGRMRGEPAGPRVYRIVRVRDSDGEVLSVKIREGLD